MSWENIPGLAERCSWKEKDVWAMYVFMDLWLWDGSSSGVNASSGAKYLQ